MDVVLSGTAARLLDLMTADPAYTSNVILARQNRETADRHGVRLFTDGTAILATGQEVSWDELPERVGHGE